MEFEIEGEAEVSCSHFSKIYLRETIKLQVERFLDEIYKSNQNNKLVNIKTCPNH